MGRVSLFGSYVAASTPIHRLDARVKLAVLALATVLAFCAANPWAVVALAAAAVVCALAAGVSPRSLLGLLKPTALVLALALVCNALLLDGTGDLTILGPLGVSWGGLARGATAVLRILSLVAWCAVVSATTTASAMVDAVAWTLRPLGRLGLPVDSVAMTLSLALRFVPMALAELERLRDAQSARGVDFGAGPLRERLGRWTSVFVPLTVALFRRAAEVSEAMEDRCWGMGPRTRARLAARWQDLAVLAGALGLCVLGCMLGR